MSEQGYFDLQVNGYVGVDFNQDDLDAESLHRACERLIEDGTDGILATIITESIDRMEQRLAKIVTLRQRDPLVARTIQGFHIEGPFLSPSPVFRGVHPEEAIKPANADQMKRLLDAAGGLARIVTLAPEFDDRFAVTRMVADTGVVASAGHCDPTVEQLRGAIDAGLSMFTHLGNGCPMQMHRHDNITQRVLSLCDRLWCAFIADGVHIQFPALGNYLRLVGPDRAVIVSDAMAAAGLGTGTFSIGRHKVQIDDDLVAWAPGKRHLMGAVITMKRSAENLAKHTGLDAQWIHRLTVENPRRSIAG